MKKQLRTRTDRGQKTLLLYASCSGAKCYCTSCSGCGSATVTDRYDVEDVQDNNQLYNVMLDRMYT